MIFAIFWYSFFIMWILGFALCWFNDSNQHFSSSEYNSLAELAKTNTMLRAFDTYKKLIEISKSASKSQIYEQITNKFKDTNPNKKAGDAIFKSEPRPEEKWLSECCYSPELVSIIAVDLTIKHKILNDLGCNFNSLGSTLLDPNVSLDIHDFNSNISSQAMRTTLAILLFHKRILQKSEWAEICDQSKENIGFLAPIRRALVGTLESLGCKTDLSSLLSNIKARDDRWKDKYSKVCTKSSLVKLKNEAKSLITSVSRKGLNEEIIDSLIEVASPDEKILNNLQEGNCSILEAIMIANKRISKKNIEDLYYIFAEKYLSELQIESSNIVRSDVRRESLKSYINERIDGNVFGIVKQLLSVEVTSLHTPSREIWNSNNKSEISTDCESVELNNELDTSKLDLLSNPPEKASKCTKKSTSEKWDSEWIADRFLKSEMMAPFLKVKEYLDSFVAETKSEVINNELLQAIKNCDYTKIAMSTLLEGNEATQNSARIATALFNMIPNIKDLTTSIEALVLARSLSLVLICGLNFFDRRLLDIELILGTPKHNKKYQYRDIVFKELEKISENTFNNILNIGMTCELPKISGMLKSTKSLLRNSRRSSTMMDELLPYVIDNLNATDNVQPTSTDINKAYLAVLSDIVSLRTKRASIPHSITSPAINFLALVTSITSQEAKNVPNTESGSMALVVFCVLCLLAVTTHYNLSGVSITNAINSLQSLAQKAITNDHEMDATVFLKDNTATCFQVIFELARLGGCLLTQPSKCLSMIGGNLIQVAIFSRYYNADNFIKAIALPSIQKALQSSFEQEDDISIDQPKGMFSRITSGLSNLGKACFNIGRVKTPTVIFTAVTVLALLPNLCCCGDNI